VKDHTLSFETDELFIQVINHQGQDHPAVVVVALVVGQRLQTQERDIHAGVLAGERSETFALVSPTNPRWFRRTALEAAALFTLSVTPEDLIFIEDSWSSTNDWILVRSY
jgi:hypothetical protein